MEGENVSIMSSWPLYTGSNYMNYSLNWENETALYRQWLVIYMYECPLELKSRYNKSD
jgi:hypothetical protein